MSSPGAPPAEPTFEASKCARIIARALASVIGRARRSRETLHARVLDARRCAPGPGRRTAQGWATSDGARARRGPPVPAVERRHVTRVPGLPEAGGAEVEVGADLAADGPQVMPEVDHRRTPPEPVAVVDAVDDQPGLEHQRVRDHRVVLGVGVLLDVEVLL